MPAVPLVTLAVATIAILHIEPRDGSSNRCPQPCLLAVYDGRTPPTVRNLPTSGCTS